jgi:hypothetical protein
MTEYISTRCAVCRLSDGLVINIIMATPSDPALDDCQLIELMANQYCDIGLYWNGVEFIAPVSETI